MAIGLSDIEQQSLRHYLDLSLSDMKAGLEEKDRVRGEVLRLTLAAAQDDSSFLEFIRLGVD
ncbi:hypothetical protein [Asticcacaulis sp. YBE204]|uniref:hypothetical protein n=1 Tax=Asticcacaulis sp. YBE204 TaxID=1282363 RepID=UPI0003C3DCA0|nr:hypothetical protein [Asticcacaulis sp. YBE204]ESQ77065.1 hypothetical protein AEYBE204_18460 [Asticcacaulis sp. YBE204]